MAALSRSGSLAIRSGRSTRPQTVGYGLVDSPAGQCAWIIEKFWAWTDCDGHPENVLTRDELLDNMMLYWLPAAGASSARLYWESIGEQRCRSALGWCADGMLNFSKGHLAVSRAAGRSEGSQTFVYWNELDRGGHFAAFEQPELFVSEVRSFFRLVR